MKLVSQPPTSTTALLGANKMLEPWSLQFQRIDQIGHYLWPMARTIQPQSMTRLNSDYLIVAPPWHQVHQHYFQLNPEGFPLLQSEFQCGHIAPSSGQSSRVDILLILALFQVLGFLRLPRIYQDFCTDV